MSIASEPPGDKLDAAQPPPQRGLRVGLNLLFLGERSGGAGRYAAELPGALLAAEPATEVHVFVSKAAPASLRQTPWSDQVRWITVPTLPYVPASHLAGEYALLPALALTHRLDVLHSPANTGPVRVPATATVVSVLDLIWMHRPSEWEANPRVHATMRRRVAHSVSGASRIFAISHAAAEDLARSLGVPRGRIDVTPLGARGPDTPPMAEDRLRATFELGNARVLLCVAQKRPYKNLQRLIRALPALDDDVVLVLAGAHTAHESTLQELAKELAVSERVRFLDWLSEEQLEGLYALSSAFVLPSLIEGFGLPVLEAMLRGVPVACSGTTALGEVAGEAALTFDPEDQQQIVACLRRLLSDRALADRLRRLGRERAQSFTWRHTGAATLSGYRRALSCD